MGACCYSGWRDRLFLLADLPRIRARGFVWAFIAFVGLSFIYKFGASPMFAVAASVLSFYFNAVGVWLPVTSYVVAAPLLYVDLKRDNLWRRIDPYKLGAIHDQ